MATPDFPFTDPIIVEVIGVTLALAWFMMVAGIWVSFCWKTTMKNHGKTWGKKPKEWDKGDDRDVNYDGIVISEFSWFTWETWLGDYDLIFGCKLGSHVLATTYFGAEHLRMATVEAMFEWRIKNI